MRAVSSALFALACCFATVAFATAAVVTTPSALGPNDSVNWGQLGSAGASIPSPFTAHSAAGNTITGAFTVTGGGTVGLVCPATNCNWGPGAPGFNAGDFLVWAENANGNGTGPLTLTLSQPVFGAGLYLQMTAPGTFTAVATFTGPNVVELLNSDSSGDPVFLGDLESTADITGIQVGISSCLSRSISGCDPTDFAVNTLLLRTGVPEPATFVLVFLALGVLLCRSTFLRRVVAHKRTLVASLILATILGLSSRPVEAQDTASLPPGGAQSMDGTAVVRDLPRINFGFNAVQPSILTPSLPTWSYQIVSPVDGNTYNGYMVGLSPFNRGARTTTIPVVLIPVIVVFHNTSSGFMTTFDPTSAPDAGCTAGQTAFSLVENSPIFQNNPWTLNGVDVGNTQYVDAFRRANFWSYVQNTGNAYHTLLSYTVGSTMTLTVNYTAASAAHEVMFPINPLSCTNPTASGVTNGSQYSGVVDMGVVDAALQSYIATHGITANQLPVFIMYNVVMTDPNEPNFYFGGYHTTEEPYPQNLTTPGQTYLIAEFQTNGFFSNAGNNKGTPFLSHEVAEWMDDPGVNNATPLWGHIGQVSGCQGNLEVGDALTGTNLPGIAGPNGFTYYMQELVFYSWFFRTPSIGAGGLFSDNGTFTTDAGAVCH